MQRSLHVLSHPPPMIAAMVVLVSLVFLTVFTGIALVAVEAAP